MKNNMPLSEELLWQQIESINKSRKYTAHEKAVFMSMIVENNGYQNSHDSTIERVRNIIIQLKREEEKEKCELSDQETMGKELKLRREIEEYYLQKQLIDAITELGEIPRKSEETRISIGFIDIANYTYLSRFLSPLENQVVLNGLYSAFNWVLQKHGGYLNKIEGDSIMFHFGGVLDPQIKGMDSNEEEKYLVSSLFYTCVEMQRVCVLFNQANDSFLKGSPTIEIKNAVKEAFLIIKELRTSNDISSSINAHFQIRIRIGANIGDVLVGNFGPDGAKQWDLVGLPVINAKRMESSAPVGGLRISDKLFNIMDKYGIVDDYYDHFIVEARALGSVFQNIKKEELFKYSIVYLKDKKNAQFTTYSVEVNPGMPESIASQCRFLLEQDENGANTIIDLLQYYRGNKFIIGAIESMLRRKQIVLHKNRMVQALAPEKYKKELQLCNKNEDLLVKQIEKQYTLFMIFEKLGEYQDLVKKEIDYKTLKKDFHNFDQYMDIELTEIQTNYREKRNSIIHKAYFYNIVYPLVFGIIKADILVFQQESLVEVL